MGDEVKFCLYAYMPDIAPKEVRRCCRRECDGRTNTCNYSRMISFTELYSMFGQGFDRFMQEHEEVSAREF